MRIGDLLAAKRDGAELSPEDMVALVLAYARGELPDYQMSAFLMACCIRGMSPSETAAMTRAMVESGTVLDLSGIPGTHVDKHSTGGVGDKTSLVLVPMLAACGLRVPKMSGRGLGFTGGTLDKLESIPGLTTALDTDRFLTQVRDIGAAIAGQSERMVPADKKMYALRDVTGTVECIPLIAASVMSKKIACSCEFVVLDVKVGSGAFMRDLDSARRLSRTMIDIGKSFGRRVTVAITDMSQPLGSAVGNALEVREAIVTLSGGGPSRFRLLCEELCALALEFTDAAATADAALMAARSALATGSALEKFGEMIAAQNGNAMVVRDPDLLPRASGRLEVRSERSGVVSRISTARIGSAAGLLGAGRQRKEDSVDPAAGLTTLKHLGDPVERGEPLAALYWDRDPRHVEQAAAMVREAYTIGKPEPVPDLIYERLR